MNKFDLTGEYFEAYQQVKLCARSYQISGEKYDDAMQNLLDILYTAQQNNRAVELIVGYDVERFSKEYFSEYTVKDYCKSYIGDVSIAIICILSMSIYDVLRGYNQTNIAVGIYFVFMHIVVRLFGYFRKNYRYRKTIEIIMYVLIFIIVPISNHKIMVDTIYPLVICGLWTLVYVGLWLFNRFKKR